MPVITGPDNLFALPELAPLLAEELARLPAHARSRPVGRALLLQPLLGCEGPRADTRHLLSLRLQVGPGGLSGDVACQPDALPFEDDAFQLVLAQHAGDACDAPGGFIDELARVLAPGGVLLWFGLNPWSPWLAWAHWQARHGRPLPHVLHAERARRELARHGLVPDAVEHLGSCWPWRRNTDAQAGNALLAPLRSAYQITASKQRAVLTPLRRPVRRERLAMPPPLAAPSRRACA